MLWAFASIRVLVVADRRESPRFVHLLEDVVTPSGKDVSLTCRFSGVPSPTVCWKRNGLIVADTEDLRQTMDRDTAKLEIVAVCEKHTGIYECVAQNDAGLASTSCHLTVNSQWSKCPVLFVEIFVNVIKRCRQNSILTKKYSLERFCELMHSEIDEHHCFKSGNIPRT